MNTDNGGTSTSAVADNDDTNLLLTQLKSQLKKLDVQKQALESEAQAIVQELTSPGENGEPPMGIDSPLVDSEGYPRGDIDLYRARSLRKRFHEIQTDHKALSKQIQEGLVQINMLQVRTYVLVEHDDVSELIYFRLLFDISWLSTPLT